MGVSSELACRRCVYFILQVVDVVQGLDSHMHYVGNG